MQSQLNRNWSCSWMLKCQQLLAFKHLLAGEIQRLKVLKQNNNFIFLFCAQLSWEWKKFYNPGARHSMKLANASECGFFPLHLNPYLTLYMLGNFSWFFVVWCFFPKLTFPKNSFRNTIRVSNNLDPDQTRHSIMSGQGPSCLLKIISRRHF